MDPRDRAARRERLRARAVTTTVVATVVAAPVLALWAAYRGAPATGEPVGADATRISASESEIPLARADGHPYAGQPEAGVGPGGAGEAGGTANAARTPGGAAFAGGAGADVSVEVISRGAPPTPERAGAPGRLSVAASSYGTTTLLTLTASGGAPVDWRLWSDAPWLRASRTAGTLAPGESVTLRIMVDRDAEPVGAWAARVGVDPGGAVVSIRGSGRAEPTPGPDPDPPRPTPTPTPTPTPEQPDPTPTPTPTPPPPPTPEPPGPTPTPGGTVSADPVASPSAP
jgi:hypothetical protein